MAADALSTSKRSAEHRPTQNPQLGRARLGHGRGRECESAVQRLEPAGQADEAEVAALEVGAAIKLQKLVAATRGHAEVDQIELKCAVRAAYQAVHDEVVAACCIGTQHQAEDTATVPGQVAIQAQGYGVPRRDESAVQQGDVPAMKPLPAKVPPRCTTTSPVPVAEPLVLAATSLPLPAFSPSPIRAPPL